MAGNDNGFAQGANGAEKGFAQESNDAKARLEEARGRLQKAEDAWALEPSAAADHETLECGLKLNKPAIPHAWALAKAAQAGTLDTYGVNLVTAYILSKSAEEVRNSLMGRLTPAGLPGVVADAEKLVMDSGASPQEVLSAIVRLTREAFPQKKGATAV